MGEEPSAHGMRMRCRDAAPAAPQGSPGLGGMAQAHPPLVTEQSQQPSNPVLSDLGQETDVAWQRKHLKIISAPCAFPGRNMVGTGGAGWKDPGLAPVWAGAVQLGSTASHSAASAGMGAQSAGFDFGSFISP